MQTAVEGFPLFLSLSFIFGVDFLCVYPIYVVFGYGYVEGFLLKFKDDYVLNGAFKMVRNSLREEKGGERRGEEKREKRIIIIKEKAY